MGMVYRRRLAKSPYIQRGSKPSRGRAYGTVASWGRLTRNLPPQGL